MSKPVASQFSPGGWLERYHRRMTMKQCDCCGEMRDNCSTIIAYGLETTACGKCRGAEMKISAKFYKNPKQGWSGWIGQYDEGNGWSYIGGYYSTKKEAIDRAEEALLRRA